MRPIDLSDSSSSENEGSDDLPALLSDPYTRHLIECLAEEGGELSLSDLSLCVATRVAGDTKADIDDSTVQQVEIFMHHGHLPRLTDHGIVEYDPDECRIELVETDTAELSL